MSANTSLSVQTGVPPVVILTDPANGTWFSSSSVDFEYNVTDANDDLLLAELIINGSVNATNISALINGGFNDFNINLSSGQYTWSINVTDTTSTVNSTTLVFYVDLEDPNVTLVWPPEAGNYTSNEINLSFNVTDNLDESLDFEEAIKSGQARKALASDMKAMEQRLIIKLGGMLTFSIIVVGAFVGVLVKLL